MNLKVRRPYRIMFLAAVALAAGIGVVRFTGAFSFQRVEVVGDIVPARSEILAGAEGEKLFAIPPEAVMEEIISDRRVVRVDFEYDLPDAIRLRLNGLRPLAMIIGGGRSVAVDERGYCFPWPDEEDRINCPVITGGDGYALYHKADDHRLGLVIDQLRRLRQENREFFPVVATIDVSESQEITVYIDGLDAELIMFAGDLCDNLLELKAFLMDYNPDLERVKKIDLRSDGLIIAAG